MSNVLNILVFLCFGSAFANTAQDSLSVKIDSSLRERKVFSENLSEKYSGDEFDYDTMEGEAENLVTRFINWFFQSLEKIFGIKLDPATYQILEILVYAIVGIILLYIVVRLLAGHDAATFFTKKGKSIAPLNIQEEHIENVDFDTYIEQAIAEKKDRKSVV